MPTVTVSLTASQAVRGWRGRKEGIFGHYNNNSGPTGGALEAIHILERVPETAGAPGLSWGCGFCILVVRVSGAEKCASR